MNQPQTIDNFSGLYGFLSNFYASTNQLRARYLGPDGSRWAYVPTVEHAFQAAKAANQVDWDRIVGAGTASQAKRLGRRITLREDWEAVKVQVMRFCLTEKFTTNPDLGERLLATYPAALIEGNTWGDRYWGQVNGAGTNMLGQLLMEIRDQLRADA